jgi:hypothetical protein
MFSNEKSLNILITEDIFGVGLAAGAGRISPAGSINSAFVTADGGRGAI